MKPYGAQHNNEQKNGTGQGYFLTNDINPRFEFKGDGMLAGRDNHSPKHVIHPEMRGQLPVNISIPAFIIIDLREYSQLFRGGIGFIDQFIRIVTGEFDRSC